MGYTTIQCSGYSLYKKVTDSGAAAINFLLTPGTPFRLLSVKLHLQATGGATENLVIQQDSEDGSAFDTVLLTQDMASLADKFWQPTAPELFSGGDSIKITYYNTNLRAWGLTVSYEVL